ncbi:LeuA family protein [Puniceibacterium sp. IMCC21224]|uniref:LeuA family protein n=1 Tax=Puniceibacterium sp. IMCC21224 TaxID=1618204 RepID=UPI0018CF2224|nr:2-isopropylmalate synthase [Puniceibacterium sp. IMCC21224]
MTDTPENGRWPSPFNAEANHSITPDRKILFADCTLRDGEQQAGLVLNRSEKITIAKALDALGVHEIEAGTVASSDEDRAAIEELAGMGLRPHISVLCRGMEKDIDDAKALGCWGVRLSFPVSPIERKYKLKGIADDAYLARAKELTHYAKDKGLYVVFSPYDTTRADLPFLRRFVREMEAEGTIDRLRIVDTTGCALPGAITRVVSEIREHAPTMPLEIHCHNDFGLACANTLAGLEAGADYVSGTINGIGERSGNVANEEVAMALEVLYGYSTGLDLKRFTETSKLIEDLTRVKLSVNKPVVGQNSFRHEAGMVIAGLLKNPYTAEAYDPSLVGQQRSIVVGKKSGLASIAHKVDTLGLTVSEDQFPAILQKVKETSVSRHGPVTDDEFREIALAAG